jgi:cbb3-type cytochrome oxidase subunit 3
MAEINIQRKKRTASPWLLILLVLLLLAAGAWYLLRRDSEAVPPAAAPAPAGAVTNPAPEDVVTPEEPAAEPGNAAAPNSATDAMAAEPTATPADFYAFVADNPAAPDYARRGLLLLSDVLVGLSDRSDLRDQTVDEKRNDLTSATERLEDQRGLKSGFVAAAEMMRILQQRGYTSLENDVNALSQQASRLTGSTKSPTEQQATQKFFQEAANVLRVLEKPAA